MQLPEGVKPEDVMHPTGLYYKNPTHTKEAERASDQSEIVKSILGAKRQKVYEKITFLDKRASEIVLPGFLKIKDMSSESVEKLMKVLMRYRPNIFKVVIDLGDYPGAHRIDNTKTRSIGATKPRFHTEVAEEIANVISDPAMMVVRIVYTVHNAEPGSFYATGEVYGAASKEDYDNMALFNPSVELEYFQNN
jgi:hypothetical protein